MIETTETKLKHSAKSGTAYPSTRDITEHLTPRHTADEAPILQSHPEYRLDNLSVRDSHREHPIDTTHIAEILENTAEVIQTQNDLFREPLLERISKWLDLHGLDRSDGDARELLSKQAALQILLKSTLYEDYHRRGDLRALTDDITKALRHARRQTGDSAFDENVLDEIITRTDEDVATDIAVHRHRLLTSSQPAETIARIYETLTAGNHRQVLGQYRTLPDVSDLMRSWATRGAGTILDPGLGAGALSTPIHPDWQLNTDPDHAIGVDRSPFALLMGTVALSLAGQPHDARAIDFLDLSPEELSRDVDAVIANPPYTDSQTLDTADKHLYRTIAEQESGYDIPAKTPLYAYFLYHAQQFLTDGDRMATITPQAWLATTYGRTLKRFLLDEFRIKALVLLNPETISAFDGPATTGLIAFLEASSGPNPDNTVRFIRIDDLSELKTATGDRDWHPVRDLIRGDEAEAGDWGVTTAVRQRNLSPTENWQARFDPVDISVDVDIADLPTLGDFVTVSRGPTTGDVGFFCLSESEAGAIGLDEKHLSKIVRRPSHIDGYDYRETDWQTAKADGKDVWLLDPDEITGIPESITEFARQVRNDGTDITLDVDETDLLEYLREGVTDHGLAGTQTLETRQYWYRPRHKAPPKVLVQSSGRDGFKCILNESSVRNTNACYGFYDIELSTRELKALLAYLNSNIFSEVVRQHHRTLDDGFQKIEPRDLERAPVIDPFGLSDDSLDALSNTFDTLRGTARQNRDSSEVRNRIDRILGQVL